MSKNTDISKPESRKWLKQWRAVYITRQALLPTVSEEATQLHDDILQKAPVPACTTCSSKDVQKKNASCRLHTVFRDELVKEHAYGQAKGIGALTLKNTKAENWVHSPWEIAKVFMPPSGYENKTTIEDTDFNGIAAFIINCQRFQRKIRGSICETAREAVNHIRHMPDISSSALTDKATIEFIDNMYALLNEPILQTRPEAVQARKQLDELKTADPSKDENAYKYICNELHDAFQQRLADIEMKLQTKETDTEKAKEDLHTHSQQVFDALKQLSDDAMHGLSRKKDDITLAIKDERRKLMDFMTNLEQKAAEHIKQSVTDGKRTLETDFEEKKRQAAEHIEQSVTDGKRTLETHVEEERRHATEHIEQSVTDGKRTLETHVGEERRHATEHIEQSVTDGKRTLETHVEEERRHATEHIEQSVTDGKRTLETHVDEEKRHATEHIEQSVADGKRTLETHVDEERRHATEHIEQSVTDGRRTHEVQTEALVQRFRKEEVENIREKKLKLKTQLIEHYKISSSQMTVRLDIDETIEKIYENPELAFIIIENGNTNEVDIPDVSHLFSTSDDPMTKKIIVEGKPGTGKTSLCKKIVHDWLKANEKNENASNLCQFEFVFYILLRHVKTESKVKAMIVEHLIMKIDSDYKDAHSLLGEILKTETCLLLLDGLDEWRAEMPHVETSWRNCTALITTRPYKLAELKVSTTQIGKHVKLSGVQDPEKLVLKVIQKLEEIHKLNKDSESCIQELKDRDLWHFSENPVLLVHIVWLWHKNKLRENMSCATLYQEIVDERWYDMCDKKKQDIEPHELYYVLSEIAFNKLFSENEDESLVFHIKGKQLEKFKQFKEASLESGIMSASNVLGERFPQYQFLHKTFQEYLAAVFLSKRGSELNSHCKLVKNIHSNHRNESVFALEQIFFFLCGLNPVAAEEFSETLNELFTEDCEKIGKMNEYMSFQDIIFRGYNEAEKNGHARAKLCLQHVKLDEQNALTENQRSKLKLCLDDKKSSLVSLSINGKNDISSSLQFKDDPTVLDLLSFKNLKFVVLDDIPFEDIRLLNLNGLLQCKIRFSDFRQASKLISSLQCSDLTGLKTLELENVGLDCEAMDILSKLKCVEMLGLTWSKSSRQNDSQVDPVDLRHLEYLNCLRFSELPFCDVVNLQMRNMHRLNIRFRTQQRAPKLMAALLQGYSLTEIPNRPHFILRKLMLGNVRFSAEAYRRLVSVVLQSGHSVDFTLNECTIEEDIKQVQEEMADQLAPQVMTPQAASTDYRTHITLRSMEISAKVFSCLVSVVLQSGHSVDFTLDECTIEEDIKQVQEEMGDQPALLMMTPQTTSADYITYITLRSMEISAKVFSCLVSVVLQSGHSVDFTLDECTIEEDIKQVQDEMGDQPALLVMTPQAASTDYRTHITLRSMEISAKVFSCLVSVVLQSGHSVDFTLDECTIEEDINQVQDEMGDQPALLVMTPQTTSTDYITHIILRSMNISAKVFSCLVSVVLQSGLDIIFTLNGCTIEEDINQVQDEMGDQPALLVMTPQTTSADYITHIILRSMNISAKVFSCLVSVVLQSGHTVYFTLDECTIEEDIKQVQEEMGDQPALLVMTPQAASTDYRTHITLRSMEISAKVFSCLVSVVLQSGHSVDFTLDECTIEEDINQVQDEMGNQPTLQVVAPHPAPTDYTTNIILRSMEISAKVFSCLVSVVLQSGHSVGFTLDECTIEEDINQVQEEMGNQPALLVMTPQTTSADYITNIILRSMEISAKVFSCLVSVVLQSGLDIIFTLYGCTIEEDIKQLQEEMGDQPAFLVMTPQTTSADYITYITLRSMEISAKVFSCLVSVVLQSGHSVDFTLDECTIEEDIKQVQEEMGDQPALLVMTPQAASTDYITHITLRSMEISAKVFSCLVSVVLQSGHSVDFTLDECTIEEDINQVQDEMGNQPTLQVVAPHPASTDYITHITLRSMEISAKVFSCLVSVVLQSGHSVGFTLDECTIEEDINQVQNEMGNQPTLQVVAPHPAPTDYTTNISLENTTLSAEVVRRLVSVVLQSGHSVGCQLECCTIKSDEEVRRLQVEMENQPAIQLIEFRRGEDGLYITYMNNV
ncbi:uncharacterized protein LOC128231975 [Mya arenaria]|uniref:uncharacterized protein LOC128231975 n=1 Tax=Mya arenaria TaxID=6604 RepID=UPI0022E1B1CB|nr:uncharacterized protein LOC128231975 [Mya arenaria]